MNELVRHIEILLLDNDCVVVPGFGGFIAHYVPAVWDKKEEMFYPPVRSIAFNTQLKMNDGVLVQSYMEAYSTDFSDATRILQKDVELFVQTLHEEGKISMANLGEISISVQGLYVFSPYEDKILSPVFYGTDCFNIQELRFLKTVQTVSRVSTGSPAPKKNYVIMINRALVRNAVAAVAAILLFFYLSAPIENTYVERHNYAQLLPINLLIEKQSLLTTPVGLSGEKIEEDPSASDDLSSQDVNRRLIAVKEVKIAQSGTETVVSQEEKQPVVSKKYHIIIGSVKFRDDAESMVANLKADYPGASVIVGDGRIRVSLASHSSREDADRQLMEIRKNNTYKDAWLLIR